MRFVRLTTPALNLVSTAALLVGVAFFSAPQVREVRADPNSRVTSPHLSSDKDGSDKNAGNKNGGDDNESVPAVAVDNQKGSFLEDQIALPKGVDSASESALSAATDGTTGGTNIGITAGIAAKSSCELETYPPSLTGRLLIGSDVTRSGKASLAVLDLDQRRITTINTTVAASSFAGFSPDGTEIGMTVRKNEVKLVNRADWDGTNPRSLTGSNGYEFADWTAQNLVAIASDGRIILFSTSGERAGEISGKMQTPSRLLEARLSPDFTLLAFTTTKFWPGSDVCLKTLSSNSDTCPLAGSTDYRGVRWQKSAELIAYTFGDSHSSRIGVLNRKTKTRKPFAESEGRNFDPVWNPSGDGMIFMNSTDGKFSILFQEADEQPPITIANCPQPTRMFDWNGAKTIEVEALRVKRSLLSPQEKLNP